NGQFYQLAFHNDVIGQEQMDRMGYDPKGALYKAVGNLTPNFASTGVFQKLEPDNDPSRADYLQLANGINENSPLATRRNTVFDLLDLPQVINHLAGTRWCAENDDVWANMSLYRDTFGDGLWRNIPFDMNASWGQLYGGSNPLEATVDASKSHPLYGGSSTGGNFNRLYDVIVRLPETRQMLLRRQRSILDLLVQPPGTPFEQRILENRVIALTNLIGPEALLDRAKWGASPWAANKTFAAGVGDLLNQFIEPRRRHWYLTHSITNTARAIGINGSNNAGIPLSQPEDAAPEILEVDFNPLSGNQAQEYVALTNRSGLALDLSGWKLSGAVDFTFHPGTVLPSNSVVYVSPDVRQFRARSSGPRGGQGLFVVGPYSGQLSARGETVRLLNSRGKTAHQLAYVGDPSPAQRWLRITEIFFNPPAGPAGSPPSDDLEFLELRNVSTTETLDLAGVRLVDGVEFDFGTSLLKRLPPGERVVVVAQPAAFAARYGSAVPGAGPYSGRLDNGGERLRLLDARGEEILEFEYKDGFPAADGGGYALEVVDESAAPDAWNDKSQWRAGTLPGGTPGTGGTAAGPRLVAETAAAGLVLRFTAPSGRRCQLQVSESLENGPWTSVLEVESRPEARAIEHPVALQGDRRFYRVLLPAGP
ncbi:MAG: lamin tail domain-containing protein, partial [Verrucomicrobiota bacterium]